MAVLKYTEELKKLLGSKTKPEPWLHCAFLAKRAPEDSNDVIWAIYVWDTREVVEQGSTDMPNTSMSRGPGKNRTPQKSPMQQLRKLATMTKAIDNHQKLKGSNWDTDMWINRALFKTAKLDQKYKTKLENNRNRV